VVEGAGVIEAFGRSRDLVRGNGWPVFGAIVIAYLIAAPILALVASALFFDLGGGAGAPAD
jgi:phosphate/sulfate permease